MAQSKDAPKPGFASRGPIAGVRRKVPERLETYRHFITGVRSIVVIVVALVSFILLTVAAHGGWVFAAIVAALELWVGFTLISKGSDSLT